MVAQYATRPDIVTHHATNKSLWPVHRVITVYPQKLVQQMSMYMPSVWQQNQNKHLTFEINKGDCRCVPHLGGLARACFTNHHNHLVLSDDLQQLITAVVHRQKAPLLLQGPALGPVTDSLHNQMLS